MLFALSLVTSVCFAASTKIKCSADLPANNPYGLPVSWGVELDTYEDTARVSYSGGPKNGVIAKSVVNDVLSTEEYAGGWDIGRFGYKVQDHGLRVLLAFREEGYKIGELRFRAKLDRLQKGAKLLDVATAHCQPM